jgi:isopenicillin N synthase-like dioxygenase
VIPRGEFMVDLLGARRVEQAAIPVVDIAGLWSPKPAAREAVGRKIRHAAIDQGFFYLAGHQVPDDLIAGVLAETRRFFHQPIEAKRRVDHSLSACRRGFDAYRELTADADAPPDLKESFSIGPELKVDDPRVVAGRLNHGPNLWPENLPAFRPTMIAYLGAMQEVGRRVLGGIALSLGLPEDHFAAFCRDPMATLRLLHYPPQPENAAPGEKGAGAHTDWNALTILLQDDVGGLQLYDRRIGWLPATPLPGTLIVNIGDMLSRWTNDLFRSTVHRVINASGRERYSIPFFFGGNPDQTIEALPGCYGPDNPPRYPATTAEGHLREMQTQAYGQV